jgi:hypothetical protein
VRAARAQRGRMCREKCSNSGFCNQRQCAPHFDIQVGSITHLKRTLPGTYFEVVVPLRADDKDQLS